MNCIYQYWLSRPVLPGAVYGSQCMGAYAARIGAEYVQKLHEPFTDRLGVDARWFDKLRPCYDASFAKYEKVLVVDHDVFPVASLTASIFEEQVADFGMVEEPDQPAMRAHPKARIFTTAADQRWASLVASKWGARIPCDAKARPRTWNAGVILLREPARLASLPCAPSIYHHTIKRAGLPACYATEQCYLNMLAFSGWLEFTPLPLSWNRQIHAMPGGGIYDKRDAQTKFVHVMLSGADHRPAIWHDAVVNALP